MLISDKNLSSGNESESVLFIEKEDEETNRDTFYISIGKKENYIPYPGKSMIISREELISLRDMLNKIEL